MKMAQRTSRRSRSVLVIFALYLVALFAAAVWFGLQNLREQGAFNIADWLINYSGGFIRRGLPGQVVLWCSRISHLTPSGCVFGLQLGMFAALYVMVWLLVRRLRWHVWTAALAFSPATLGFVALVGGGAFRKELLFLLALASLLLLLQRGVSNTAVVLYLFFIAVVLALSHEGLVMYWPYLLAAVAVARQSLKTTIKLAFLPTLLLIAVAILAGRYSGTLVQAKAICSSVGSVYAGRGAGLCGGSIAFLGEGSAYYRAEVVNSIRTNHYLRDYAVVALLAFLPCVAGFAQLNRIPVARRQLRLLLLCGAAGLLCSTALFVLAIDWGRWLYIDVFSWMLLLFFMSAASDPPRAVPILELGWNLKGLSIASLLAAYLLCWHVPVTGYEGRGWGYLGMARRHLQRLGHSHPDHPLERASVAFTGPSGNTCSHRAASL